MPFHGASFKSGITDEWGTQTFINGYFLNKFNKKLYSYHKHLIQILPCHLLIKD